MKPRLWASLVPFGIGHTKPHHYLEIARAPWANWHAPLYAWRILSRGVCDARSRVRVNLRCAVSPTCGTRTPKP